MKPPPIIGAILGIFFVIWGIECWIDWSWIRSSGPLRSVWPVLSVWVYWLLLLRRSLTPSAYTSHHLRCLPLLSIGSFQKLWLTSWTDWCQLMVRQRVWVLLSAVHSCFGPSSFPRFILFGLSLDVGKARSEQSPSPDKSRFRKLSSIASPEGRKSYWSGQSCFFSTESNQQSFRTSTQQIPPQGAHYSPYRDERGIIPREQPRDKRNWIISQDDEIKHHPEELNARQQKANVSYQTSTQVKSGEQINPPAVSAHA